MPLVFDDDWRREESRGRKAAEEVLTAMKAGDRYALFAFERSDMPKKVVAFRCGFYSRLGSEARGIIQVPRPKQPHTVR